MPLPSRYCSTPHMARPMKIFKGISFRNEDTPLQPPYPIKSSNRISHPISARGWTTWNKHLDLAFPIGNPQARQSKRTDWSAHAKRQDQPYIRAADRCLSLLVFLQTFLSSQASQRCWHHARQGFYRRPPRRSFSCCCAELS